VPHVRSVTKVVANANLWSDGLFVEGVTPDGVALFASGAPGVSNVTRADSELHPIHGALSANGPCLCCEIRRGSLALGAPGPFTA
jgi:hypothetical protein